MKTVTTLAPACNAGGQVEETRALNNGSPAVTADHADLPVPGIIVVMDAAADLNRRHIAEAAEKTREFIRTIDGWDTYEDAVEAMAAVDHLERGAASALAHEPTKGFNVTSTSQGRGLVDVEATARLHCADDPAAWDSLTPADKQINGTRLARRLVLAQSQMGHDAMLLADLADSLHDAMQAFTAKYDADAAERLLRDAGLHDESHVYELGADYSWRADYFRHFHPDVQGFTFTVGKIAEALSFAYELDSGDLDTAKLVRKPSDSP